jgi:hypothetical protein
MKTQHLLLLSIAALLAHASPARPDCGITKTFEATNLCGQTYGGQVHFPTYLHLYTNPIATAPGKNAPAAQHTCRHSSSPRAPSPLHPRRPKLSKPRRKLNPLNRLESSTSPPRPNPQPLQTRSSPPPQLQRQRPSVPRSSSASTAWSNAAREIRGSNSTFPSSLAFYLYLSIPLSFPPAPPSTFLRPASNTTHHSCYNTCTDDGHLRTPTCQFAPSPTSSPIAPTAAAGENIKEGEEAKDRTTMKDSTKERCAKMPFMCRPKGWGDGPK